VGSISSPKKFHVLDKSFISNYTVDPPDNRTCHSVMYRGNDEQKSALIAYVLKLKIEDFVICDEEGQRQMQESDLTDEDYIKPVN